MKICKHISIWRVATHTLLCFAVVTGMTACAVSSQVVSTPHATLYPPPPCDFGATVAIQTWVDTNENGVWDKEELPLQGVVVWANETPSTVSSDRLTETTSNAKGESELYIFLAGCPKVKVEILAVAPHGYQVTTHDDGVAVTHGKLSKDTFLFGFMPVK